MTETDGQNPVLARRFLTLEDIQAILAISRSQAYSLVRTGQLRAIRVGGRGQWRIETTELDAYIDRAYKTAQQAVTEESPTD